ncbi:MAG: radical SAM protein [Candidatus Hadarchaeum sp.]
MNSSIYQAQATRYLEDLASSVHQNMPMVRPLTASFAITTRCNSKCSYCKIWELEPYDTPLSDLKRAVDELSDLGVYLVSLSGGEPFLHNSLPELIAHIRSRGLAVSLTTNGSLLKSGRLWPVLEAGLDALGLSLDTIDSDTYATIRGLPLMRILEGLHCLSRARAKFPRLAVSVNCVISKANIEQIVPLVEYCTSQDIAVGFQPLHLTYASSHEPVSLTFDEQDLPRLHALIEQLLNMQRRGYLINNDPSYLEGFPNFLVFRRLPEGFVCTAGFTTISIDHALNVRNCWPMDPIGNLHTQPLTKIWYSEDYKNRRAMMLKLECPKCWQRCHVERSEQWLRGFFDWIAIRQGPLCQQ